MALPLGKLALIAGQKKEVSQILSPAPSRSQIFAFSHNGSVTVSSMADANGFCDSLTHLCDIMKRSGCCGCNGYGIVAKGIKQDESTSSVKKPRNDFLTAQVDSLRHELEKIALSRPVTIVTTVGSSANRYGAVVIVIVVGSGYIWWKGWKLPDFMFATRGNLAKATATIAKPLEDLFSSIPVMKRHLSSRMDLLDNSLDEVAENTASRKEAITDITAEVDSINANVAFFRNAVETKICRIEGKQASSSNSRASLEPPPITPSSRIASLLQGDFTLNTLRPPDSNGSHQETNGSPAMMDSPKGP